MANTKIVFFSDLHYAPERPINNGSIIERKLTEYAEPLLKKLTIFNYIFWRFNRRF